MLRRLAVMGLLLCASAFWGQSVDSAVAPMAPPNAVPEGTSFLVQLEDKLDTANLQPGQRFKAKLGEDLTAANGLTIPRGKKIKGHVSSIEPGLRSRLLLSFDEIDTNHGWVPLVATVTGAPGEHGLKPADAEGGLEREGPNTKRVIETAAVGAAVGTVAGGAAGGGRGAGIGAGAGAGAGALAGLLTDHDLKLNKGTTLEVRLDHPLQIPAH